MNYLLAGDSNGCIHAIQDGVIRKTIVAGSVVNTVSLKKSTDASFDDDSENYF